jgi:drug/metabolite transporter (DMT)-like permease
VTAVLGGLGAAVCWAITTIGYSRSSKLIGSAQGVAWVMIVGLFVAAPGAAAQSGSVSLGWSQLGWLALSGAGNVCGLLLVYVAFRTGKVGLVAPIVSTEGAIAAVIAILAGESLGVSTGVLLVVITAGVIVSAAAEDEPGAGGSDLRAAGLAALAAFAFGASIYATGRVSEELPLFWAALPARVAGVAAVALPLALTRRLRLTRAALPYVVVCGVGEVLGFLSYAVGARHGIAIAAVLASQFAALAAVVAYLAFGERLGRVRTAAVVVIAAGVAALTALQAT